MSFNQVPKNARLAPQPFKVHIEQQELDELQRALSVARITKPTRENTQQNRKLGITAEWLANAKKEWQSFDWRKVEDRINRTPNFKIKITEAGHDFDIHFAGLFSTNPDAIPLLLLHGWPGSFMEFLTILEKLASTYTPSTLPYHVIVPSLPGFAFSTPPPLDNDIKLETVARIMDKVMCGLGFETGYIAQGGDLGSYVARIMGVVCPSAKAVHLNMNGNADPGEKATGGAEPDEVEKKGLERSLEFMESGTAYALEHATRPATIGLVLSSSPLATLSWIGEKFLAWTDRDPPLQTILEGASLYWLTDCAATSIYTYREHHRPGITPLHGDPRWHLHVPFGFSWFPCELRPVPKSWIATTGDLVFFKRHPNGGHFAALEEPDALLGDIEEFATQVWPACLK